MNDLVVWSGWIGGMAIGGYLLFQFWFTNKLLGCSSSYGNVCGMVSKTDYFRSGEFEQRNNWRLWFILGIPLGGFIAVLTSPGQGWEISLSMGALYDSVLPQTLWLKACVLILGGVLMGFGARMAGGCTSGHAIAGISLLNPPSILASILFFAGGIVMVQVLFNVLGRMG